jgi:tetratricopeptide (TPR) repeat protein
LVGACLLFAVACTGSSDPVADAKALYEQGQLEQAVAMLEEVLDQDPSNAEANYQLGTIYIAERKFPLALWPLRKAAETDEPVAQPAGLLLGNLLLATGQYEEAINVASGLLDQDAANSAARVMRAQARLELKHFAEAVADTEILLVETPRDYTALHTHTTVLAELGRYDEAETHLEALYHVALDDFPSKAPNMCIAMASFRDEIRQDRSSAKEKALECFEAHPDSEIVLEWAVWLHDATDDPDGADGLLVKATDLAPHKLGLWEMRAQRLHRHGETPAAIDVLKQAAELLDTPAAWNTYATMLGGAGQSELAIGALERGIEVAGDDAAMSFVKADLLTTVGRYDEARTLAESISEVAYQNFILGRIAEAEGNPEEALVLVEKGLEIWPSNPQARYNAGMLAQRLGRISLALEHYREATRADAQATDAALRMAELLMKTGEYVAANDLAIRHAQNRPWDAYLPMVGAEAALRAGAPEEARKIYIDIVAGRHGLALDATLGVAMVERETAGPESSVRVLREAKLDWADPANDRALFALVADLVALGDSAGAKAELAGAEALRPDVALHQVILGDVQVASGALAAAESAYGRAVALEPGLGAAIKGQATVAALREDLAGAIALFDQAAEAASPDPTAAYHAAQLVLQQGDAENAITRLRSYLLTAPGAGNAANDLAWLLAMKKQDLDYALELARRAVRVAPSADTFDTLGVVQMARSVPKLAIRAYQQALRTDPTAAGVRYRLALAQDADGRTGAAVESLRAALDLGGFPEVEEAKLQLTRLEQSGGNAQ